MNNHYKEDVVKNALEKDVNLSLEDYARSRENASKSADFHASGAIPDIPEWDSEELKHKRIQSNFYGTALNFYLAFNDHLLAIRRDAEAQTALLAALVESHGIKVERASPDEGGDIDAE